MTKLGLTALAALSLFAFSGGSCVPEFDSSALKKPAKRCMSTPAPIHKLKVGDDLVEKHIELGDQYTSVASRLRCTQRYINAVTN